MFYNSPPLGGGKESKGRKVREENQRKIKKGMEVEKKRGEEERGGGKGEMKGNRQWEGRERKGREKKGKETEGNKG